MFLADTEASVHCTGVKIGLTDLKSSTCTVSVMNGGQIGEHLIGSMTFSAVDKDGNVVGGGTIVSMHYSQEFKYNLISIPQLLRTGWKMVGDDTKIQLKNGRHTLKLDRVIPTKMGWLYGVVLRRFGDEKANEMAAMAKDRAPMAIYMMSMRSLGI